MNYAIILAAGSSSRMQDSRDKLLLLVAGKPVVYYSLAAFNDHPEIDGIVVVANKSNAQAVKDLVKTWHFNKVVKITVGGKERQESVQNGFKALPKGIAKNDLVLVHNAANPLVTHDEISETIRLALDHGAAICGHFPVSTIKEVDAQKIIKTHDRQQIFAAETPQVARFDLFVKAFAKAKKEGFYATDEAMLLENIGQKVAYTQASPHNFKITTDSDIDHVRTILGEFPGNFRVGIGQDSHCFVSTGADAKGLTLCGLFLKDEPAMQANSDGDVALHALFNAISQAIGEMSLGFYADEMCENGITDSKKYLEIMLKKLKKAKLTINSVGLMIECKTPKIDPLVSKLKKSLSAILSLPPAKIGITATSGEELTPFGQGLGIQCFAIVSLKQ